MRLHQDDNLNSVVYLRTVTTEVWHRDVRNVQLQQTFFPRLFDTGQIGVSSSANAGIEIEVGGLHHPDTIKNLIDKHRISQAKAV